MNPNQEQKLKALIASSPILNATERVEWLALLELMNDKQLGELEKILDLNQSAANGIQQTVSQPTNKQVNNLANQNIVNNKQPVTNNTPPPEKQLPHLTHIVNLPNHWSEQAGKHLSKQLKKNVSNKTGEKKGFANKLKQIFGEKELTTPKPTYQLEIAEHSVLDLNKLDANKQNLPNPAKKLPVVVAPPVPVKNKNVVGELVKPEWKPQNINDNSKGKFVPGVNFEKSRAENIENIKQHVKETQGSRKNTNINLHELSDLKSLTIDYIQSCDFSSLVDKLKQLIVKFGYFNVLFNIEASKVYKSYLSTGLKLISEGQEQQLIADEGVLDKEEFEKFADLLAKIQSS